MARFGSAAAAVIPNRRATARRSLLSPTPDGSRRSATIQRGSERRSDITSSSRNGKRACNGTRKRVCYGKGLQRKRKRFENGKRKAAYKGTAVAGPLRSRGGTRGGATSHPRRGTESTPATEREDLFQERKAVQQRTIVEGPQREGQRH